MPHLYIRGTSELGGEETVKVGLVYLRGIVINSGLFFVFGKSIPDKAFAIAAEIEYVAVVLPPFLLDFHEAWTSSAVLTPFALFNSPIAIATSAESI